MRILVIAKDFPSPANPYAGVFVLRQAQALASLGHQLRVVRVVPYAPPFGRKWHDYRTTPAYDDIEGIPVETVRALVLPRMLAAEYLPLQVGRSLGRIAKAFHADVVHGHFLIPSGQIAAGMPFPSVVTAHGSDAYDWPYRRAGLQRAARDAARRAGRVVAVSEFIRERVARLGVERHVDVVFNGADERVFKPANREEARRELGIPAGRFVVAFAGRPTRAKGAFELIEAVARLRHINPIALLAGPDPADDLRDAIARLCVDARPLGLLDQPRVARVIAACDAFCLPSYNEGLPAAVCEAMLSARPVVATPVGGIPEVVADGETGFLVPPGDPRALARRLHDIAQMPELGARMGEAARAFAQRRLTWRINALRHETLYRQLLATSASAVPG